MEPNLSPRNIAAGILGSIAFISVGLFAAWHCGFSPQWVLWVYVFGISGYAEIARIQKSRQLLRPFFQRKCTGIQWKQAFPDVPGAQIRDFLTLFVDAFCIRCTQRLCFAPSDSILSIYHALNPDSSVDALELAALASLLKKKHGVDLDAVWKDELTLGELFAKTRHT